MNKDFAFGMAVSSVRFGVGVTREVGMDLAELGARLVMVVTDPVVGKLAPAATVIESLERSGVPYALYNRVRVEPSDESFLDAIAFGRERPFDAFVAVGGGSTIDTAKAVNLYTTYPPADFLDYVNPPIGKGLPVPGPLKPLMAIPTTAGTGSETTGVAVFDLKKMHAKTGIANRRLKPTLGYLDPENTRTMPPEVAASTGLDILSHAVESYTAMPFTDRLRPDRPAMRPAYQGSNPISAMWSMRALRRRLAGGRRGRRRDPRRPHDLVHAAAAYAHRAARDRLHRVGHSGARRRHAAAAPRDEAVAASGRPRGVGPAVRGRDGRVVTTVVSLQASVLGPESSVVSQMD